MWCKEDLYWLGYWPSYFNGVQTTCGLRKIEMYFSLTKGQDTSMQSRCVGLQHLPSISESEQLF